MNPSIPLDLLLKSTALLALAAAATQLWPRASAASRHLIWVAAFATIFVLPLGRLAVPRWTFALHRQPRLESPAAPPVVVRVNAGSSSSEPRAPLSPVAALPPAVPQLPFPSWETLLPMVWCGGVLIVLARRFLGALRARKLRDASKPLVDQRAQALAADVAATLGVRAFDLRESTHCRVPLTWGTWRPVVMLPIAARDWPTPQLLAVLRHEIAHVARRDHCTRLLAQTACAVYWPSPFVWLAARALRRAQEQACDDLVLRAGTPPHEYAAQLFEVCQMLAAPASRYASAMAMAQPSTLEVRIRAIVDRTRNRAPAGGRAMLILGVCTAALGALSVATQVGAESVLEGQLPALEFVARQPIEVSADFLELPAATFDALFPTAKGTPGQLAILSPHEVAELRKKLEPLHPANYLEDASDVSGNRLLGAPRVTTPDGQRAIIEILRERRIVGADGGPESYNEGLSLETEPRLRSDGLHLPLHPMLVKQRPNAIEPLTLKSFHVVEFQTPEPEGLLLQDGEVAVFGGWETAHAGRKLLLLVEGRSAALALATRLSNTMLPEVRLSAVGVLDAADHLMQRISSLSITTAVAATEQRVTVNLHNVSAARALREVARVAGLRAYVDADAVHFAASLPSGALAQANAIILPEVKLTGLLLPEALDRLKELARQQHPEAALLIRWQTREDFHSPPLTITLANTPFSTAVAIAAELAGCELSASDDALYIHPPGETPPGATRVLARQIGGSVARIATEAEMRAAENIAVDVQFIDLPLDQFATLGLAPPDRVPEMTFAGVLTANERHRLVERLATEVPGGGIVLTAPRVKTNSGKEAIIEIDVNLHPEDPPDTRVIETLTVPIIPTRGRDAKTLDLEIAPFRTERRAATNAPVFSTRKITTSVAINAGHTLMLVPRPEKVGRAQLLLITASFLTP